MKRVWLIAVLAALVAAPISSSDDPAAPSAALTVTPGSVTEGQSVTLDASASRDDGAIASYAWDLDGDGSFERVTGTEPTLEQTLSEPGDVKLGVRVVDDSGLGSDAFQSVTVQPKPQPKEVAAAPEPAAPAPEPEKKAKPAKQVAQTPVAQPRAEPRKEAAPKDTTVRAAASTSVSIKDFSFAPKSVTVNTGDSVTWRNSGDEVHTATGSGFDTGNLSSGQSGSHTFNSAGTFSYKCSPHPFMTGTVKVVGAGGGGGGVGSSSNGDGTGTGDSGAAGSSGSGSGDDLPSTGLALGKLAFPGVVMLLTGLALRRRVGIPRG